MFMPALLGILQAPINRGYIIIDFFPVHCGINVNTAPTYNGVLILVNNDDLLGVGYEGVDIRGDEHHCAADANY